MSTETNPVVTARANKLKVQAFQGIKNKVADLEKILKRYNFEQEKVFFVGNDINDYLVMKKCGYSACPSDSHKRIKKIATFECKSKGGDRVIQEILEDVFEIDFLEVLYT